MSKLSVQEAVSKLKEKNPNPRRLYNKGELTMLLKAMLTDDSYTAKDTKIKAGKFITEDRKLAGEFKKGLIDIVKQLGLNTKEAEAAIENYKIPTSFASAVLDAVSHAKFVYMKDIRKAVRFIGESDVQQTLFIRSVGEKEHRIPKDRNGNEPVNKKVKVAAHSRIGSKARVNPTLKQLLK